MSPITHYLAGWAVLERFQVSQRDKALVALAGIAPDLDGLGIVIDFATRALALPETNYYQMFHRVYGHGLAAALLIAAAAAMLSAQRQRVALCAFISVHLHYVCDLLGSRGTSAEDVWGIHYFSPFSTAHGIAWSGQWPLVSWQNLLITAVLLAFIMARAAKTGYSPLAAFSVRADTEFIVTLRKWLRRSKPADTDRRDPP